MSVKEIVFACLEKIINYGFVLVVFIGLAILITASIALCLGVGCKIFGFVLAL